MSANSQVLSTRSLSKTLQLGPLNYALVPHDDWGEETISAIGRHFSLTLTETENVKRFIHLIRLPEVLSTTTYNDFLKRKIREIIAEEAGDFRWERQSNELNTVWHSDQTCHALWTAPAYDSIGILRFHFPWDLLLRDLAEIDGGLIHAGMAVRNHHAWLFLAPPGGGKSTTLATAPANWQVPADDAAMIWPASDGNWRLYPLLSWSTMLTPPESSDDSSSMANEIFTLGGMLMLKKAAEVHFEKQSPIAAAAQIYCALTQYPAIFLCDHIHHETFFRSACQLARQIPCWQLDLPLGGNIWPGIAKLVKNCE